MDDILGIMLCYLKGHDEQKMWAIKKHSMGVTNGQWDRI